MKILRWLVALTEVGEPALSRPVGTAADFEYWYGESSPGREGVR